MPNQTVTVTKPSKDTKLGITLTSFGNEAPLVGELKPDGVAKTALTSHDVIVAVNGKAALGHEETNEMLKAAVGEIKLELWREPLEDVLASANATAIFLKYLTNNYAEENLEFILAIDKWQQGWDAQSDSERKESAQALFAKHLSATAEKQVNCKLTQDFHDALKEASKNTFDEPYKVCKIGLTNDIWPRFSESAEGAEVRQVLCTRG